MESDPIIKWMDKNAKKLEAAAEKRRHFMALTGYCPVNVSANSHLRGAIIDLTEFLEELGIITLQDMIKALSDKLDWKIDLMREPKGREG